MKTPAMPSRRKRREPPRSMDSRSSAGSGLAMRGAGKRGTRSVQMQGFGWQRRWIESAAVEGVAAQDALQGEPSSAEHAVPVYDGHRIARTRRLEPTRRAEQRRQHEL